MKKKLWNKPRKPESLSEHHLHMERILLPRLRYMGYFFFLLFLTTLLFAILTKKEQNYIIGPFTEEVPTYPALEQVLPNDDAPDELDLSPEEVLNFYIVAATFALVGVICLAIVRKKKKVLFPPVEEKPSHSSDPSSPVD